MSDEKKWYFKWWSVVVLLIALGPFAFPFLWKSKDFNLFWKLAITVVITAITVGLIWSTWAIVQLMIDQFRAAGLM